MWELDVPTGAEPIGYRFLYEHFALNVISHYCWSYVGPGWSSKEFKYDHSHIELRLYPKSYQIESDPMQHLEFALKHEGLNLNIVKQSLSRIGPKKVSEYVQLSPTGKYARKVWFLYEFLLGSTLPIDELKRGSYVPLLDSKLYYCGKPKRSSRHRVLDNLLGSTEFCPIVRKSVRLHQFEGMQLPVVAETLAKKYDSEILARATRYLFTKETIASWEIEREKPDKARIARFVSLLQQDFTSSSLSKQFLLMLQKQIIDPRFALDDYRSFQNYVGEEVQLGEILVHYIAPKPDDLPALMDGLIQCAGRLFLSGEDAVVIAAVLSFGFVYMHPFWDGNGRIHRFLIHYTLAKLGFAPRGIVFPVSAVMLRSLIEYDRALESFSSPLNELISDYQLNDIAEMKVFQETADYYKYIDFTPVAEFLYRCVEQTIHADLEQELNFLSRYDEIKESIKKIVDMPEREVDLFIRCVRQNAGTLSKRKRESLFKMLGDDEIRNMERVVREGE